MYTLVKEAEELREKMFKANGAYPYVHKNYEDARLQMGNAVQDIFGYTRIADLLATQAIELIHETGESVEWCVETVLSDMETVVNRARVLAKDEYEIPYFVDEVKF